jgi:hypothetical protein
MRAGIKIYRDGHDFEVWCGVSDGDNTINAHIIGIGLTKEAAIADAIAALSRTAYALQEQPDSFIVEDVTVKR